MAADRLAHDRVAFRAAAGIVSARSLTLPTTAIARLRGPMDGAIRAPWPRPRQRASESGLTRSRHPDETLRHASGGGADPALSPAPRAMPPRRAPCRSRSAAII